MSRSTVRLILSGCSFLALAETSDAQPRAAACCTVASVNASTGVVTGTVTATGYVFEFKARNQAALGAVKVGQAVQANFANNQVSLDGRTVFGTVTKAPAPPSVAVRQPPAAAPSSGGNVTTSLAGAQQARIVVAPPKITLGTPVQQSGGSKRSTDLAYAPVSRFETRTVPAVIGGRQVQRSVLHLYGLEGIENAPSSLPDGVRRLLEIHARKTPAGEHTHYIVDPVVAQDWAKTHEVPSEIKVKSGGGKCKGNEFERYRCRGEKSWDNWSEATSEEWERLRKKAQGWWDDAAEILKECTTTTDGWTDHVASGPTTPITFSVAPQMSVDVEKSASKGSSKGSVKGTVTLGFPLQGSFRTGVTFFYIPCLPGVYRLRSLTADGNMTVSNQIGVNVTANGSFDKTFTVPPSGGLQYLLYIIPIMIGDIPVAVIDVSAYVEGDVRITADGQAIGNFAVTNSYRSAFDFECSGKGCTGHEKGATAPTTTNESAQIQGQVQVKPGIFTALQLSFDYNILQGRAGPEPYLLGIANGCGNVSAAQTAGGPSTSQTNGALVADLDWGLMLRGEALAGGQRIGNRWEYDKLMRDKHMWFKDLVQSGSTALMPAVTGPGQFTAAQPAAVKVRMPSCYPYTDKVKYRLTWDGGATLKAPGTVCSWQAGTGTCSFDPTKDLTLSVTWPNAGAYNLSVQLVEDEHSRRFLPAPQPTRLNASVGTATSQP